MGPFRVLVSGATGDVAQGVLKALERSNLNLKLITTCVFADSAFLHKGYQSFLAPYSASEEYLPFLTALCQHHEIDLFIPTVDSEIGKIAEHRTHLESETGVRVCVGTPEQIRVCQSKVATADFLKDRGFAYPQTMPAESPDAESFIARLGFPIVAKPKQGRGAQDVFVAKDPRDLEAIIGNPRFCLQEWLTDADGEFTTGLYLGDDGQVKGVCTLERELKGGSTFKARRVVAPELERPLEEMAKKLGLKYVNIQSRKVGDRLVPFEFNGRFSGTTGIVSRVFNGPEMLVREWLMNEAVPRVESTEEFVAMRYYEEVFTTPQAILDLKERSLPFVPSRPL